MKTDREAILKKMDDLKKRLEKQYPPRSYCHADIFTAYWHLRDVVEDNYN